MPFEKRYRVRSDDNFTLQLLLLTLLISASVTGYFVLWYAPSPDCSPFRGQESAWGTIEEQIALGPRVLQDIFDFVAKAAFLVPLMVLLLYVWGGEGEGRQLHGELHRHPPTLIWRSTLSIHYFHQLRFTHDVLDDLRVVLKKVSCALGPCCSDEAGLELTCPA